MLLARVEQPDVVRASDSDGRLWSDVRPVHERPEVDRLPGGADNGDAIDLERDQRRDRLTRSAAVRADFPFLLDPPTTDLRVPATGAERVLRRPR